jgi:hypothetical protein
MDMKLWAIADIHLSFKGNWEEWAKLRARREETRTGEKKLADGLILAGDGKLLTILVATNIQPSGALHCPPLEKFGAKQNYDVTTEHDKRRLSALNNAGT